MEMKIDEVTFPRSHFSCETNIQLELLCDTLPSTTPLYVLASCKLVLLLRDKGKGRNLFHQINQIVWIMIQVFDLEYPGKMLYRSFIPPYRMKLLLAAFTSNNRKNTNNYHVLNTSHSSGTMPNTLQFLNCFFSFFCFINPHSNHTLETYFKNLGNLSKVLWILSGRLGFGSGKTDRTLEGGADWSQLFRVSNC